jgi:uncharacterized protein involved in outer membrane biogenesis
MVAIKNLSEHLHRSVVINDIDLNPFALSINITGFSIQDRETEERLFSFKEFYANIQVASAVKGGVILKEVRVENPYVNISRHDETSYNFSDLLAENQTDAAEPAAKSKPLKFSINNIQVLDGSIDFLDSFKDTKHSVRGITLKIPMISNLPHLVDIYVQPLFQATVNDTPFMLEGRTKPFSDSLETIIDLDIDGVNIPHYLAYVPVQMNFKVLSGTIDVKHSFTFTQYTDRPASLIVAGDVALNSFQVVDMEGNPLINIPRLDLALALSDLISGEKHLSKVLIHSPEFHIRRDREGNLNVLNLILKRLESRLEKQAEKDAPPVLLRVDEFRIDDGTISFTDNSPLDPVESRLDNFDLTVNDFSTMKDQMGTLSLSSLIDKKGSITVNGNAGINPLSVDTEFELKDIDIIPLQPYFTDKVKILVTGGSFMTGGKITLDIPEGGEMKASFRGKAALSNFSSVDKAKSNDFLKWNSLYISDIDFQFSPLKVGIKEVALTDFYSLLIVNSDGTLNVQGIVKDDKAAGETASDEIEKKPAVSPQKESPTGQININTVTLQAGTVNFSDKHIKPNFAANLLEIGGRVSGLSSEKGSRAGVDLRGKLENYAPLEIKGTINPLAEDLHVDLQVNFDDMDLSPLTPYAHKYVGYTIQKGKLSLDLKYLIEGKKLDSSNSISLDQFTLGEKVESPDATKLPVKFAINLLKNSKGMINLDLPVKGSIDDPEFSIGSVVLKMVVNLVVKAVSSPFKLLGALVGDGEELSYIGFDYGKSVLSEHERSKLDKLAKALADRPSLNIDITGYVDPEKDVEALRQYTFDSKLRAQKLKSMVKKGDKALQLDEIIIEPEEYEKYLSRAYKEETFPKPRNFLGIAKKLPAPEMEKLIFTYIQISDDDLRLLASKRALTVKEYFSKSEQIDPGRIFLVEPESLLPEKEEGLKKSRVDFTLK